MSLTLFGHMDFVQPSRLQNGADYLLPVVADHGSDRVVMVEPLTELAMVCVPAFPHDVRVVLCGPGDDPLRALVVDP